MRHAPQLHRSSIAHNAVLSCVLLIAATVAGVTQCVEHKIRAITNAIPKKPAQVAYEDMPQISPLPVQETQIETEPKQTPLLQLQECGIVLTYEGKQYVFSHVVHEGTTRPLTQDFNILCWELNIQDHITGIAMGPEGSICIESEGFTIAIDPSIIPNLCNTIEGSPEAEYITSSAVSFCITPKEAGQKLWKELNGGTQKTGTCTFIVTRQEPNVELAGTQSH